MRGHDRFEALAAAHALGEATSAERAEFAAHAAACARCRDDAAAGASVTAQLAAGRDEERWQPRIDGDLEARLRARRTSRSQCTFTVLGYAVAASLVLNLAFVGGFAGRALDALRVTTDEHYAGATRIVLETRRPAAAASVRLSSPARAARPLAQPLHVAHVGRKRSAPAVAVETPEPAPPDVFAGLGLDARADDASVAFAQLCADRRAAESEVPDGCPPPKETPLR